MTIPGRGGAGNGGPSSGTPVETRRFKDLVPRLVSAIVLVVLALAAAFKGGRAFDGLWWAAGIAILWEWQALIGRDRRLSRCILGGVALSVSAPLVHVAGGAWSGVILAAGAAGVAGLSLPGLRIIAGVGVIYAGALVLAVEVLRASFPYGLEAILWLFAVVWGTDIMAYFGGRLLGGPKLWPRLSPSKTWSGFLIGIGCGALAGLAVAPAPGPYLIYFVLGLLGGIAAQAGDLFESALKRRFGVKDASHLIPGHGGVLDRLDGFTAAAVLAAGLGLVRFGVDAPAAGLFSW